MADANSPQGAGSTAALTAPCGATAAERMAAFDALPRPLRHWLANDAHYDYEATHIGKQYRSMRRRGWSIEAIVARLNELDQRMMAELFDEARAQCAD